MIKQINRSGSVLPFFRQKINKGKLSAFVPITKLFYCYYFCAVYRYQNTICIDFWSHHLLRYFSCIQIRFSKIRFISTWYIKIIISNLWVTFRKASRFCKITFKHLNYIFESHSEKQILKTPGLVYKFCRPNNRLTITKILWLSRFKFSTLYRTTFTRAWRNFAKRRTEERSGLTVSWCVSDVTTEKFDSSPSATKRFSERSTAMKTRRIDATFCPTRKQSLVFPTTKQSGFGTWLPSRRSSSLLNIR